MFLRTKMDCSCFRVPFWTILKLITIFLLVKSFYFIFMYFNTRLGASNCGNSINPDLFSIEELLLFPSASNPPQIYRGACMQFVIYLFYLF